MKQSLTILPPPRVLLGARIIAAFNTRKGTMGTKFIAKSRGDLREGSLLAVLRSGRWLTALWIGAATAADLDLDEYLQRANAAKVNLARNRLARNVGEKFVHNRLNNHL